MKTLLKLSKALVALFCIFNFLVANAQISVNMSFENVDTNMPVGSGFTPCEDVRIFLTLTNNSNAIFTGGVVLDYPSGFEINGALDLGCPANNMYEDLFDEANGTDQISFIIANPHELQVGESHVICFRVGISCASFISEQVSLESFIVTINGMQWIFQPDWEIPAMLITDMNDEPIALNGPSLVVDEIMSREYRLKVSDGVVNYFEFSVDYEDGALEFDHFEVVYVSSGNTSAPVTLTTIPTFNTNTPLIANLIPNASNRMFENEYLQVTEYYRVAECGDGAIASTFELEWGCSSADACSDVDAFQNVYVSPNNQGIQIEIYSELTEANELHLFELCSIPVEETDFGFQFYNPAPTGQFVTGSGHKWIDNLVIPIDWAWFYASQAAFFESVFLVWEGNPLGESLDLPTPVLSYNNLALTIDLNELVVPIGPFDEIYGESSPNGLLEDTWFRIEFRDAVFNCQGSILQGATSGFGELIGGFGDCSKGNRMPFGGVGAQFNVDYRNMCGVEFEQLNDYANYQNSFGTIGMLEIDPPGVTSLEATQTVALPSVELQWQVNSTSANGESPFHFFATDPNNITLFDCDEVKYFTRIRIHPALTIDFSEMSILSDGVSTTVDPSHITPEAGFLFEGTTYNSFLIEHELFDQELEQTLLFDVIFDPSTNNTFCVDPFFIWTNVFTEFLAKCDNCVDCDYVLACGAIELLARCIHDCDAGEFNTIGTDTLGFSMLRSTYGWTDENMTLKATPADDLNLLRAYECDVFDVVITGTVGELVSNAVFDGLFLQISYNYANTSNIGVFDYEFFDEFITGAFSFTDLDGNPLVSPPLNQIYDDLTELPFEWVTTSEQRGTLRIYLSNDGVADLNAYFGNGGLSEIRVRFEGKLPVRLFPAWNSPTTDLFYTVQPYGQFGTVVNQDDHLSCDPWGTNLRLLKAKANFWPANISGPTFNHCPTNSTVCENIFEFGSMFFGGTPTIESFPNEFRPVIVWPFNNQPPINISLPQVDGVFSVIEHSQIETRPPWSTLPLNSPQIAEDLSIETAVDGTSTIFGINPVLGFNDWPVFECGPGSPFVWPESASIFKTVDLVLRHHCPPSASHLPSPPVITFNFPWLQRPYSGEWDDDNQMIQFIAETACESPFPDAPDFNINLLNYELIFSSLYSSNNEAVLSAEEGVIDGFNLSFITSATENCGLAHAPIGMDHVWIRNLSDDIAITPVADGVIDMGDQLYYMGGVYTSQSLEFEINYVLNTCTDGELEIEYGFVCNIEEIGNEISFDTEANSCFTDTYILNYNLLPTEYQVDFVPPASLNGSPCDTYEFEVEIYSTNFGDIHDLLLEVTLSEDFVLNVVGIDVGGVECDYQPGAPDLNSDLATYSLDLSEECLEDGVLGDNPITVTFQITGICDMLGEVHPILFSTSGNNFCGLAIDSLADDPNTVFNLDFTGQQDLSACDPVCEIEVEEFCYYIPNESRVDYGKSIVTSENQNFALAGSYLGVEENFFLAEFDGNGLPLENIHTSAGNISQESNRDFVSDMVKLDEDYFLLGNSLRNGVRKVMLSKVNMTLDQNGSVTYLLDWTNDYTINRQDFGVKLLVTEADELMVIGHTIDQTNANFDIFIMRINPSNGNILDFVIHQPGSQNTNGDETIVDAFFETSNEIVIVGNQNLSNNRGVIAYRFNAYNLNLPNIEVTRVYNSAGNHIVANAVANHVSSNRFIIGGEWYDTPGTNDCKQATLIEMRSNNSSSNLFTPIGFHYLEDEDQVSTFNNLVFTRDGNLVTVGHIGERGVSCRLSNQRGLVGRHDISIPQSSNDLLITNHLWLQDAHTILPSRSDFLDLTEQEDSTLVIAGTYKYVESSSLLENIMYLNLDLENGNSCCLETIPYVYQKRTPSLKTFNLRSDSVSVTTDKHIFENRKIDIENLCFSGEERNFSESLGEIETALEHDIKIFPNPNSGQLTIQLNNVSVNQIVITQISGEELKVFDVNDNNNQTLFFDLSSLSNGVYFVFLKSREKVWVKRIIMAR